LANSFDKTLMGASASAGGGPSDDQFNRVSFLSHFDGANNGLNNAFDDGSASNHTITAAGNVTQGSFGPYGTNWSVDFDGGDCFTVPQDADFNVDAGSYTVECFVNTTFSGYQNIIACWDGATGGNPGWGMFISSANKFGMFIGTVEVGKAGASVNDGAWHHLAGVFTNSGATVTLYVDGAQISTGSITAPADNSASIIRIGAAGNASATSFYKGRISNLRLVKGTAVYSGSSFTAPTSALTAITNTKLLVLGSNNFLDDSTSSHVLTLISDPKVTSFGPFLNSKVYDPAVNGASAYFDASGDQLSATDSADFDVGAGLFTAEAWVYPTNPASQAIIIGQWTGSHAWALMLSNNSSRTLRYIIKSGGSFYDKIADNTGLPLNAWSHVAFSRASGNVFSIYVNGARVRTDTLNITANNSTGVLGIGGNSGSYWGGYISDARMVKGSAVYSGTSYTVPTAPLTAITNTKLLLNMADGQAIDSAAQNVLTLEDGANISTTQKKFGDSSVYLDGNDLARTAVNPSFAFGIGDFTIEGWVYLTAINQYDNIFDMRHSGNTHHIDVYFDGSPLRLRYFVGGGERFAASAGVSLNTWTHLALVRSSGTTKLYQQGSSVGSYSDSTDLYSGRLHLGGRYSNQNHAQGYFDEVRVSSIARYTSNFTPDTEPFLDKGR